MTHSSWPIRASNGLIYTEGPYRSAGRPECCIQGGFNEDMTRRPAVHETLLVAFTAIRDLWRQKADHGRKQKEDTAGPQIFVGQVKLTFNNNTASSQIDIELMKDGKAFLSSPFTEGSLTECHGHHLHCVGGWLCLSGSELDWFSPQFGLARLDYHRGRLLY